MGAMTPVEERETLAFELEWARRKVEQGSYDAALDELARMRKVATAPVPWSASRVPWSAAVAFAMQAFAVGVIVGVIWPTGSGVGFRSRGERGWVGRRTHGDSRDPPVPSSALVAGTGDRHRRRGGDPVRVSRVQPPVGAAHHGLAGAGRPPLPVRVCTDSASELARMACRTG